MPLLGKRSSNGLACSLEWRLSHQSADNVTFMWTTFVAVSSVCNRLITSACFREKNVDGRGVRTWLTMEPFDTHNLVHANDEPYITRLTNRLIIQAISAPETSYGVALDDVQYQPSNSALKMLLLGMAKPITCLLKLLHVHLLSLLSKSLWDYLGWMKMAPIKTKTKTLCRSFYASYHLWRSSISLSRVPRMRFESRVIGKHYHLVRLHKQERFTTS